MDELKRWFWASPNSPCLPARAQRSCGLPSGSSAGRSRAVSGEQGGQRRFWNFYGMQAIWPRSKELKGLFLDHTIAHRWTANTQAPSQQPRPPSSCVSEQKREFSTEGIFPQVSMLGLIAKTIENIYNKMKTIRNGIVFQLFWCQETALVRKPVVNLTRKKQRQIVLLTCQERLPKLRCLELCGGRGGLQPSSATCWVTPSKVKVTPVIWCIAT